MFHKSQFLLSHFFILLCLLCSLFNNAYAYNFSSGVFEFQQKLAKKGNAEAQYKLGNMYENGQGVKVNLDKAALWYRKSAAQNNAAAKMRLTYIDIKKNGYSVTKHSSWLKKLQNNAKAKDGESLLLLATMHKKGIVVKKDLNKSASLFKSASIRNVPGAEAELESVNALIYNNRNKQTQKISAEKTRKKQAQKELEQKEKAKREKAQREKARKEKQLAQERKKAAEQRQKQQAAKQRAQREEQERKAAEKKRLEQARQEEQRQAALAAEKAKAEEAKSNDKKIIDDDPLIDKSKCKGKKARFLTMCR